ncbi:MAG: hypothetical protein [Microviridae sp.]|nr:MAG: hypothetical protein [Microviridae sp.]
MGKIDKSQYHQVEPISSLGNSIYDDLINDSPYNGVDYADYGSKISRETQANQVNADIANKQYRNNLLLAKYQEWYNSEGQKAARMRQAGLNPDLQGIGEASDAPTPLEVEKESFVPGNSNLEKLQVAETLGGMIMSAVQGAFGLVQNIQGVELSGLELASKDLSNFNEFNKIASQYLSEQPDFAPTPDGKVMKSAGEIVKNVYNVASGTFTSRSARKQFKRGLDHAADTLAGVEAYYKTRGGAAAARNAFISENSQFRDGVFGETDDDAMSAMEIVNEALFRLNKQVMSADFQQEQYRDDYYRHLDSETAAEAQNASNSDVRDSRRANNQINSVYNDLVNSMYKEAKDGNRWAMGFLLILQLSRSQIVGQFGSAVASSSGKGFGKGLGKVLGKIF